MARKGLSAALCELHKNLYPNLPHLTEAGGSRPKTGRLPPVISRQFQPVILLLQVPFRI